MANVSRGRALAASLASAVVLLAAAAAASAVRTLGPPRAVTDGAVFTAVMAYDSRHDEYLVAYLREGDDRQRDPTHTLARRLDRTGTPVGTQASVASTPATSGPLGQAIAYSPRDNEYLLVWRVRPGPYGDPYVLYGQRLSRTGQPNGRRRTLLRPSEQEKLHLNCCEELHVVSDPRRGGYLLTWRAERGILGPHMVMGRRVSADLDTGPARPLAGDLTFVGHDVVWAGDGYVIGGWGRRVDGSRNALRTRRVDAAGRGRGKLTVLASSRGNGLVLEGNARTGRLAAAWSTHTDGVRVRPLDRTGRPAGGALAVEPRGNYVETVPNFLSYNGRADRFLLGWTGWRDDPEDDNRVFYDRAVRTVSGDVSRLTGGATGAGGELGAVAASERGPRWLAVVGGAPLRVRAFGP